MDPNELKLFRSLEYLNLALNNITRIEGLGRMEHLRKLDLTLNFVDVDVLEESVNELTGCRCLEELFLLGNPCMGLDGIEGDAPGTTASYEDGAPALQKPIGWKGCRAYIIARLPNLQFLDGKEIKRSERILATQQLSKLTLELHSLAEAKRDQCQLESGKQRDKCDQHAEEDIDEGYISDEAPTYHNPETRTKLSNELHDQKRAKEKQETAQQAPRPKGEREWEEEHRDAVQKAREREEVGREWERSHSRNQLHGDGDTKRDGGIKQCNQGKYKFWFEEESSSLVMRVDLPKHLSTSLIDVDIHPTYVSVVVKSKVLRVILPAEVLSDQSLARRSAASGCLELTMPKVDPNEVVIGLGHVRERTTKEPPGSDRTRDGMLHTRNKRERLGHFMMKEAGIKNSLKIIEAQCSGDKSLVLNTDNEDEDEDDDDEPPPLH